MIKCWIEAMRLRTLPVSVAGVITAVSFNIAGGSFQWLPALLCLFVAVSAQVASNFANEYYDYKNGLDRVGRDGPRRGVTEGDISPAAMLRATYATLAAACIAGCALIIWGGWWLVPVGIFIALGVIAYSAGPYPLSHHGLGEVAVCVFYGIIPVNFTYYIQAGSFSISVFFASLAIGLLGANVLIVNNYRDADDDKAVGKNTLAVLLGRKSVSWLYLCNVCAALVLIYLSGCGREVFTLCICAVGGLGGWRLLNKLHGAALTKVLGITSMVMLIMSLSMLVYSVNG